MKLLLDTHCLLMHDAQARVAGMKLLSIDRTLGELGATVVTPR